MKRALAKRFLAAGRHRSRRWVEADGTELTVHASPDAVEIYAGRKRFLSVSVDPKTAARLGWFLVSWWLASAWLGLRQRIRRRALDALLENDVETPQDAPRTERADRRGASS